MPPVHLALVWHQHQPVYADPQTGRQLLPWARLHAIKDYWGMARLIERSGVRATVNLVPCLLDQIEAYAEGRAVDRWAELGRRPADALDEAEALFLLDNFFTRKPETMVAPVRRYAELFEMRSGDGRSRSRACGRRSARDALALFGEGDLRDLQVLFELAWFHPLLREEDDLVCELWAKERDYTEDDKIALHDRERARLREVIPMHRRLAEEGLVELTTTPYYHPILPLLVDFRALHEAMPESPLPDGWRGLKDDAAIQVEWALASHERRFGARPRGMWPAEGAVSEAAAELLAEHGVEWIASDEAVLGRSVDRSDLPQRSQRTQRVEASVPSVASGRSGETLLRPDLLYTPHELVTGSGRAIRIIFRDGTLSDLVGFGYSTWDGASRAADDLVSRLRAVGDAWTGPGAPVVSIVLDGENPWENYPNQGVDFLQAVYARLASDERVFPGRVSDILDEVPARRLGRLFAGSWIDSSFAVWAGHEEDRAAWAEVFRCREALDRKGVPAEHPAREALRAAEGSDWYWWYGDEFGTPDLPVFDRLFRANVRAAYASAGLEAPAGLDEPIATRRDQQDPPDKDAQDAQDGQDCHRNRLIRSSCPSCTSLLGLEFGAVAEGLGRANDITCGPAGPLAPEQTTVYAARTMPELRKDPVLGRWVIIACERAERPMDCVRPRPPAASPQRSQRSQSSQASVFSVPSVAKPSADGSDGAARPSLKLRRAPSETLAKEGAFCPFCAGNESKTPPEILAYREPGSPRDGPGWRVRVVPNKFPALRIEGDLGKKGLGVYDRMNGIGAHEVVIDSPRHVGSVTALEDGEVREMFLACRDRLVDLRNDRRMVCGTIFKNVGEEAGASLAHTHTQIIVTPVVPRTVMQEMEGCKRFFDYRGRCLFCDIIEQELSDGARVVTEVGNFVAFAPYASRFPFETWVVPKRHSSHFEDLGTGPTWGDGTDEAGDLARVMKDALARIEKALGVPPYNYMVHSTPLAESRLEHYHWHIEIIPRLTRVAGFEWGTGFYINPVLPESAAKILREAKT